MPTYTCRVCEKPLFKTPLLSLKGMPKAAQHMPGPSEIKTEQAMDLDICQCSGCGLIQHTSEPVPYYRDVIRAASVSPDMMEFRKKQFAAFSERFALQHGRILEVGSGRGDYLGVLHGLGVNATGLEHDPASVRECRKKGLSVHGGYAGDLTVIPSAPDSPGVAYDAFCIMNFLEHLPDVNAVLGTISASLTDQGVGIVEVPNFDMMLQKKVFSEFITDHLFYFTTATLKTTLELNGFEVLEVKPIWHDYILSAIVKKRAPLNLSSFKTQQAHIQKELDQFFGQYQAKDVAVWGAGHQAFALINLTGIAPCIRYILDSAVFKQGKFSPGSHIPIVAPEQLRANPVKAVVVMAGSYSSEVARIIREQYSPSIDVVILRDFGLERV